MKKQKRWGLVMVHMTDSFRCALMDSTKRKEAALITSEAKNGKVDVIAYLPIKGEMKKTDAENAKRLVVALYMQSQAELETPGITDQIWEAITKRNKDSDESAQSWEVA